jgi:hypothetical protein
MQCLSDLDPMFQIDRRKVSGKLETEELGQALDGDADMPQGLARICKPKALAGRNAKPGTAVGLEDPDAKLGYITEPGAVDDVAGYRKGDAIVSRFEVLNEPHLAKRGFASTASVLLGSGLARGRPIPCQGVRVQKSCSAARVSEPDIDPDIA